MIKNEFIEENGDSFKKFYGKKSKKQQEYGDNRKRYKKDKIKEARTLKNKRFE